jgi:diaminopimelate decarboxylase
MKSIVLQQLQPRPEAFSGFCFALTPGIEAHTHESIATAHEDVKFGFSIASGAGMERNYCGSQAVIARTSWFPCTHRFSDLLV